jgi:acetyltransferase-like isoleucine patch superfamily enzyme
LSRTARKILARYSSIEIGAYSYGACFVDGALPPGSIIGRYVSIADSVRVFGRNHPIARLSTHPFFYNHRLGHVEQDTIDGSMIEICSDSWIGHGAIVTPGCGRIGFGAVIGAGSVVTKDVPDFAVVAGNPAQIIRYRFEPRVRQTILDSGWWNQSVASIADHIGDMVHELPTDLARHPLLRDAAQLAPNTGRTGMAAATSATGTPVPDGRTLTTGTRSVGQD